MERAIHISTAEQLVMLPLTLRFLRAKQLGSIQATMAAMVRVAPMRQVVQRVPTRIQMPITTAAAEVHLEAWAVPAVVVEVERRP